MHRDLDEALKEAVLEAGQHAGKAMLLLDRFRHASDPELHEAYRLVHDLMGDLGAVLIIAQVRNEDARLPRIA